jgi:hypothetical protein
MGQSPRFHPHRPLEISLLEAPSRRYAIRDEEQRAWVILRIAFFVGGARLAAWQQDTAEDPDLQTGSESLDRG